MEICEGGTEMELKNPMLVVTNMDKTVEFYKRVLGLQVVAENLGKCEVQYVHLVKEHSWGQRVVRFYDPEQVAERMDVPMEYINECMQ